MGTINRECPKCGAAEARCSWDGVFDRIDMTCGLCGYHWTKEPLDAKSKHQYVFGGPQDSAVASTSTSNCDVGGK